jgi:hypothetical protein
MEETETSSNLEDSWLPEDHIGNCMLVSWENIYYKLGGN